jgi:hypothetical protein
MATRFSHGSLEINISLDKLSSIVELASRRAYRFRCAVRAALCAALL